MAAPALRLSLQDAKDAATMANEAMNEPAASQRLLAVQSECAGDIGKFFMLAILAATDIVGPTLEKYGFEKNQGGALAFVAALQAHNADPELEKMATALKAKFMPSLPGGMPSFPPPGAGAGGAPADEVPE